MGRYLNVERHLQKTAAWMIGVAALFLAVAASPAEVTQGDAQGDKPLPPTSPAALAERFDECWTTGDDRPTPTHVIYRRGADWKVGGTARVEEALESIFGESKSIIIVHAFCI